MSGNNPPSPFNVRFPAKPATKKSLFERQRAEAEAKRQREAAETAAVYEDFVKSFDDGSGSGPSTASTASTTGASMHHPPAHLKSGATVGTTGGRRHFSIPTTGPGGHRNSGPGSLGPISHGNRPPRDARPSRLSSGIGSKLGFGSDDDDDDDHNNGRETENKKRKAADSDEEGQIVEDRGGGPVESTMEWAEEKATSKPTVRLANLPPGTSPAAIKALVANSSSLVVDAVRILPTATATTAAATDRKSVAAIVTLSAETAASDIDAAVSAMQNRYLGFGYYLNLHRHLSSAVAALSTGPGGAAGGGSNSSGGASAQPFGARPVPPSPKSGPGAQRHPSEGFAPPNAFQGGRHGRGIPPPSTFTSPGSNINMPSRDGLLYVPVRPPRDIKKLRMIHKVIEQVLDRGPEFEALLMSRPAVQVEEKWAWLWDARSEAGVWYRYRLWETVTGMRAQHIHGSSKQAKGRYVPLFEGSHAWKTPDHFLPYEFDTSLAELVSDSDYNSSDDSDAEVGETNDEDKDTFLNPLEKARLAHLLARMPTTLSKLRKGDVARVTAFALTHASRGANEIVDMIIANIERPLAYTAANPDYRRSDEAEAIDTSGAQLNAVYVVSDILSSSATSGIRHAWRFRQLFDAALRRRNVFATLGRLADKFHWGRLRADKWKRSIGLVLGHWEGWSVFSAETQAFLVTSFENPPSIKGKSDVEEAPAKAATVTDGDTAMTVSAKKSRWKTVDTTAAPEQGSTPVSSFRLADTTARDTPEKMQVDIEDIKKTDTAAGNDDADDADDEWAYRSDYTDDEALDLACMSDEDIDGEPMEPLKVVDGSHKSLRHRRRHRYDGIPLTADEISALAGDVAEMSEEGEIATDDDDDDNGNLGDGGEDDDDEAYHLSGLSSLSDSSSSEPGSDDDSGAGHASNTNRRRDVAVNDAPGTTTTTTTRTTNTNTTAETTAEATASATSTGKPRPASASVVQASAVQASAVQASSVQASSVQTQTHTQPQAMPSSMPSSKMPPLALLKASTASQQQPRKRMRAADMFADSDEGES
ncbi:hypothetical protein SBRCBS47491_002840 [Sporothrix bragantina]|uniref:CID domain-containing protein n=1 Tax=Sporothrix bragantina TaxID=671064 RepID=A0ABP0BA42_9PEZI